MSVLLGSEIIDEYNNGKIVISPFNEQHVGPNSIDVTICNTLLTYIPCKIERKFSSNNTFKNWVTIDNEEYINADNQIIDMAHKNKTYDLTIPEDGLVLIPGVLYLGATNEIAGSDYYIPMYEGRSSMARLGIQSHISAGFGDLFFKSNWTLEITVVHPTVIYPNRRIGQVYFHKVDESAREKLLLQGKEYQGKYINQPLPQASKSYLDFDN